MGNEKLEQILDQEKRELLLWKKLDIKGFIGGIEAFSLAIQDILEEQENGNYNINPGSVQPSLDILEAACKRYTIGINGINMSDYDERFPIYTIDSLKNSILPNVESLPLEVRKVLDGQLSCDEFTTYFHKLRKEMIDAGRQISQHPGYINYRNVNESERKKLDIAAPRDY